MLATGASCAPEAVTDRGADIKGLYDFFSVVAAVVFAVTAGLIAWSIVRYRARPGDTGEGAAFHSNIPLELVWFAIPQVIVIVLFLVSTGVLGGVDDTAESPDVSVTAEAFRWGWRFTYADEGVSVVGDANAPPEIYLPVNAPIAFEIEARDVQHAFYVPRWLMKRDAIPGRTNRFDITITEEGTYDGKCAEFCGLLHEDMNFTVRAVSAGEFEEWIQEMGDDGGG